jgi:hypothetical protein
LQLGSADVRASAEPCRFCIYVAMKLLISTDDHFQFLENALDPTPSRVLITSYGFYAGILADGRDTTEWGSKYKCRTRDLLEAIREVPTVQILIGLYEFKPCKKECLDCQRKYALDLIRHMNHAEKFPEFEWRVTEASHIKCVLFFYPNDAKVGIAGSRNFTDSSWEDVTVTLEYSDVQRLDTHIGGLWEKARPLNDSTLGSVLQEQGISQKAFESIVAGL